MTDVTKNSRLFAVTSTTCSTLLLAVFFHPSTPSTPTQCPLRADSSSWRKKKLCSHKIRDRHILYIESTYNYQHTRYTGGILMRCHVASGLFSWSMAAGLFAFSSRQFAPTINHNISIFPSWASVPGGECRPRSEAPWVHLLYVSIHFYIHAIISYGISATRYVTVSRRIHYPPFIENWLRDLHTTDFDGLRVYREAGVLTRGTCFITSIIEGAAVTVLLWFGGHAAEWFDCGGIFRLVRPFFLCVTLMMSTVRDRC